VSEVPLYVTGYLSDHHAALLLVHPRVVQLLPHLRVGHSDLTERTN
jgi:hypothetical protein